MNFLIRLISVTALLFMLNAIGCTKKVVYEGMYEGMQRSQDRDMRDNPGKKQIETESPMSYERYQQEREKLIEKE